MVGNLFVRLYFLIVISIVTIGIGTNWIWVNYFEVSNYVSDSNTSNESNLPTNQYELLISAVAFQLNSVETSLLHKRLSDLSTSLSLEFMAIETDQLPMELFENRPSKAIPISLSVENGDLSTNSIGIHQRFALFIPLENHGKILQLLIPKNAADENLIKDHNEANQKWLLLFFYLMVALTILYWIWPLSKDLNRLQSAVNNFDNEYWNAKVDIPNSSSIAHLAKAYNRLLNKIKRMVENEKAMANSISHELRTPLARIRFALQMAKESNDPELISRQIISAEEDIEEMNQLIAELLNYASIENHAFKASFSKGDLGLLITSTIKRLKKNYPSVNIDFVNEFSQQAIICDEVLMDRAVQNLIANGCKYGAGQVNVRLFVEGDQFNLSVSNNGKPIDSGKKKFIFDAFYQVPSEEKRKGFGLGLSIVRRIARLHKGQVTVNDSSIGGAEFLITWPKNRLKPTLKSA